MEGVGENISKWRRRRLLKQSELAEKIGVQTSTLGSYETNRREPNLTVLLRLANALNVSTDQLLGNDSFLQQIYSSLLSEAHYEIAEKKGNYIEIIFPEPSEKKNFKSSQHSIVMPQANIPNLISELLELAVKPWIEESESHEGIVTHPLTEEEIEFIKLMYLQRAKLSLAEEAQADRHDSESSDE